jgi:predicted GNAT family N-acyltransferase
MPFQEFTQFFSPADLDAMTAAYYAACLQLIGTAALCFTQGGELRTKLVRVIVAAACKGERNSKRLEEVALKALSHSRAAW